MSIERALLLAIFGAVAGVWIRMGIYDERMYIGQKDMYLCAAWVPEDREASQAAIWTTDIDGESAP
jgi:hypothetical protein